MTLSDCKRYFQKLKGDSHYYSRWGGEIILQKDQDSDIESLYNIANKNFEFKKK